MKHSMPNRPLLNLTPFHRGEIFSFIYFILFFRIKLEMGNIEKLMDFRKTKNFYNI